MEWISVEDGFPQEMAYVIVCFKKGEDQNWKRVGERLFDGDGRFYNEELEMDITNMITHWMPLPEPPEY